MTDSEGLPAERLGRALMAARAERGLKRRDLADLAGLSYPYLSEIENGRKQPSAGKLQALAAALSLTPAELLGRAEQLPEDSRSTAPPRLDRLSYPALATSAPWPADDDDDVVAKISRSVATTIQSQLGPWLQEEIARMVREELRRSKDDPQ